LTALALKVFLTPLLIAAATFVQRRFGGLAGGLVAGLPLTSAPVSAFLAFDYGDTFAANAAAGTLLGLVAMSGFCAAYAFAARRFGWAPSLAFAAVACAVIALGVSHVPQSFGFALGFTFPVLILLIAIIGHAPQRSVPVQPPWWDIPARMIVAAAAVLLITGFADVVGPRWSGLLSTLPIFAAVMGVFSHRHAGAHAAHAVLRGVAVGALGAATFFLVVGALIERLDDAVTYLVAVAGCAAVAAGAHALLRRGWVANSNFQTSKCQSPK
jgi:hypothetical protein